MLSVMERPRFVPPPDSTSPDNHYFNDAVVSWNIEFDGYKGTTGIIVNGFIGKFDIPEGGEKLSLVEPQDGQSIQVSILDPIDDSVVESITLTGTDPIFIPAGRDELRTPENQKPVRYLCLYPGRAAGEN